MGVCDFCEGVVIVVEDGDVVGEVLLVFYGDIDIGWV